MKSDCQQSFELIKKVLFINNETCNEQLDLYIDIVYISTVDEVQTLSPQEKLVLVIDLEVEALPRTMGRLKKEI